MASPTTVDQLDGITLIINDHRNVEAFFALYESASDPDTKLRVVAKMIEELTMHAAIEEQVLYPIIADRIEDGQELRSHAVEEHQEAREDLAKLENMAVTNGKFDETVRALIDEVRHHVEEEETELLPALRKKLSSQELAQLADDLRRAKTSAPVTPSQEQQRGRRRRTTGNGNGSAKASAKASKKELYERAQQMDIPGRSQMSKEELEREIANRS